MPEFLEPQTNESQAIGDSIVVQPYSIANLPPLVVGGAVFNTQYSSNPSSLPIQEILEDAFAKGLNAIDTSPYYGPSEILLGEALKKISFPRQEYYICTKAGRVKLDDFDYSRDSVRKSVERSLERLNTSYLDLVYMHDIEFVKEDEIFDALKELKLLKTEGLIKNFGISGYPVRFLHKIASRSVGIPEIGPLDAVLSYSNGCIQNTRLFEFYDQFFDDCKLKKLSNGSILSMSLLRSDITHSFHPASKELKDKVYDIAHLLKKEYNGLELADLATRFALRKWLFETVHQADSSNLHWNPSTSIVLGVSNVEELDVAIRCYWQVKNNIDNINTKDDILFEKVKNLLGPEHFNEVWPSGIDGRQ
ncbi:D-threo-aldose 1-dehydrogenase [Scheffersomyces stipitis CBS 6054]|uniref:D-threo-aldose 1-dehydrogenase n=1 Tax=Scheffersomyces stipitis (strain ATCC 58785 / CBS 6054 / NBRC 10063 / NRRL Y-11545) TaxID=322104 RepID=A3LSR5_PICST|nr:D-threo-aldose 1-dehydrogenase [Scheffersomyces stipitis CBS 6054]ABN66280.2 D-threo-aldose 1-dehydrogenase [Scheffersomyces stipitis CBS 6054]